MKKFIAIMLMFTMMFITIPAFAECATYMPQSTTVAVEQSECKSMFVVDENHELSGIKAMKEANTHLKFNVFEYGTNIRGILSDGTVLRSRGLARLEEVDEHWFGLTSFDVEVELFEEYEELVTSIVKSRVEAETPTNPAIVASTLWLEGSYAGHIFYTELTRRVHVGYVYFTEQNCCANLWAGDIDGDDELELGFVAGTWHAPAPTLTPEPEKKPNGVTVTTTITTVTTSTNNKSIATVQSGCGTTVVNTGNGNNITTTSTKVNGNNNTTTTTNNTTNSITLFGVTINKNTNTTTTNGTKIIMRPTLMKRNSINNPGKCH